jgi:hypothetical protein
MARASSISIPPFWVVGRLETGYPAYSAANHSQSGRMVYCNAR